LKNKRKTEFKKIYDKRVLKAAPFIPIIGIKYKFNIMFNKPPKIVFIKIIFVRFSIIKYFSFTNPIKTNTPAQICIDSTLEALA
jgi:hypothetical protein